jgi:hypothetical protein
MPYTKVKAIKLALYGKNALVNNTFYSKMQALTMMYRYKRMVV